MKITQTISVTREEYTMVKGTYADMLGMFLSKIGRTDDGKYTELMSSMFGNQIKIDVDTKTKMGKFAFLFHITDTIELDVTLELTSEALSKILGLGFTVFELAMPLAVAGYEMSNATDKINAVKAAHADLNQMAAAGTNKVTYERTLKD